MKKLKILLVSQYPFSDQFGVGKVHFDLKKEFERMGHAVDTLSSDDYYPKGQSVISKVFGPLYTYKILSKLKKIAYKYDVIDANYECVPFHKDSFGFKGLLVYRSHGLQPVYRKSELSSEYQLMLHSKQEKNKLKTRFGNIYRYIQKNPSFKDFSNSVKFADIVHCLNQEEYNFLIEYGLPKNKILLLPNGVADLFVENANKSPVNNKSNVISFVGSWTIRKGIKDFNEILNGIEQETHIDKFNVLGCGASNIVVLSYFDNKFEKFLNIVSKYSQTDLISLIKESKVGVFPSYIEGFGLSVVELLACGIPVVAYDVAGPAGILKDIDSTLLIEIGNKKAFAKKVINILKMNEEDYAILAEKCKSKAQEYLMSRISESFINSYIKKINSL